MMKKKNFVGFLPSRQGVQTVDGRFLFGTDILNSLGKKVHSCAQNHKEVEGSPLREAVRFTNIFHALT